MSRFLAKKHSVLNRRKIDKNRGLERQYTFSYRDNRDHLLFKYLNFIDYFELNDQERMVSFFCDDIYGQQIRFNMIKCPVGKFDCPDIYQQDWGNRTSESDAFEHDFEHDQDMGVEYEIKYPFMLGETEVTVELFTTIMGGDTIGQRRQYKHPKFPCTNIRYYDWLVFCNKLSELFGFKPCYKLTNIEFAEENLIDWNSQFGTSPSVSNRSSNQPLSICKADVEMVDSPMCFRLPYYKEWMFAAKAGTRNKYAGSNDDPSSVAWFEENALSGSKLENGSYGLQHVAQLKPNEWGFYDMHGNAKEWCGDDIIGTDESEIFKILMGGDFTISENFSGLNLNTLKDYIKKKNPETLIPYRTKTFISLPGLGGAEVNTNGYMREINNTTARIALGPYNADVIKDNYSSNLTDEQTNIWEWGIDDYDNETEGDNE